MAELTKKERVEQRREKRLADIRIVFCRPYELARAWGVKQPKAQREAYKEVEKYIADEIKKCPQEKSFILACFKDFTADLNSLIKIEER